MEIKKDGKTEMMTPTKAVEWMKSLPAQFGNLFKSGAATGIGASSSSSSSPAGQSGPSGAVDLSTLTQEQYEALRKDPKRFAAIFGSARK